MRLISLREHACFLASREGVRVFSYPYQRGEARPNATSSRTYKEIFCPPVNTVRHYWLFLHEMGHVVGPYQDVGFSTMLREIGAWRWAQANALVWDSRAASFMKTGLQSYATKHTLPEDAHPFWLDLRKISNLREFVKTLRRQ